ncbi:MAG: VanZ family protein [bacterium]
MDKAERWIDRAAIRWLPAVAWGAFIFYLSSLPQREIPRLLFPQQDKVMHLGLYGFLGFFLAHGMRLRRIGEWSGPVWRRLAVAMVIAIIYGLSDEFHQSFVEGRSSSMVDFLFDSIGAALGALFLVIGSRPDK